MLSHRLTDLFPGFSDANRGIRLKLLQPPRSDDEPAGLPHLEDVLLVTHVSGHEEICGALEYRLLCISPCVDLPLKDFMALPAEIGFVTDRSEVRRVCGLIAEASAGEVVDGYASYRLVLRDALALMGQRTNTRVFLHASELDVTEMLLSEWRSINPVLASCFDVDWSLLAEGCPAREFTMQHNESDADFLRRLWKRRGIGWFIRPGQPALSSHGSRPTHTLVLFNDAFQLPPNAAGAVRYHRHHAPGEQDSVSHWSAVRTLRPGSVSRQCWDHVQGGAMRSHATTRADQGVLGNRFADCVDDYLIDAPHTGDDLEDYRQLGQLRMQRHAYESKCFHARSDIRALRVGEWITLQDHPHLERHPAHEREFILTSLDIDAENNLPHSLAPHAQALAVRNRWKTPDHFDAQTWRCDSDRAGGRYLNRFSCVRRGTPVVPAFDPRRDIPTPRLQNAHVVGPRGEEVYCDALGRVKLRFPGTRIEDHERARGAGASDSERDSAWVRVASTWAGSQWGAISLPRVGDEVIVAFLGGDPDKPIIIGRVYGATALPPSFSHIGALPGNRFLAGIKSKEISGQRYNQLRLDDTPGQISAQLSSQHGYSELNLGWLTHPRERGAGDARGEGAELRSDQALALRGGQGVLISAAARPAAGGSQLDRHELLGLMGVLQDVQQQLAALAQIHRAGATEGRALAQLQEHLERWEAGSNTDAQGNDGHRPLVAVTAPAGVAISSDDSIAIGAQTQIDMISVGNTQLSVGKKLLARVAESISLFAHRLGIKLVAASGKLELQTDADNIEATSAKRIVLTAAEEIVLQAPRLRFVAQGAQIDLGGGAITQQSSGDHVIRSADFHHLGGADAHVPEITLPVSNVPTDERFILARRGSGRPHAHQRYRIELDDGSAMEGITDEQGRTELSQDMALRIARLHLLKE
ncbi:MAG TPA: type VI secretion system Vgr family protein [Herbaspirillum sp.]|uniref:type VI secretion system Vgr family protein n=1 Tax=Herbaspirillum sp. TaxID=1890675 RepID=UPI002D4D3315|nr:type VI secretion system Vgr family protein [Herbaspirillum sp.]HZG21059.1 type VI secretion system Vgr family protein [Herbaspirillum sp.]